MLILGTFLCRPLKNNNVKWPNSAVSGERDTFVANFNNAVSQIQFSDGSDSDKQWLCRRDYRRNQTNLIRGTSRKDQECGRNYTRFEIGAQENSEMAYFDGKYEYTLGQGYI